MDFSTTSEDDFADIMKAAFDHMHTQVDALSAGPQKALYETLLNRFHARGTTFLNALKTGGAVQPLSGGTDKGDGS